MRHLVSVVLVAGALLIAIHAPASEMRVTYLVDAKALKRGTPSGTSLTFALFRDPACSQPVGAAYVIDVEDLTIVEHPRVIRLKGAPRPPDVARIEAQLSPVESAAGKYLRVGGAGIVAVGAQCQVQTAPPSADLPVLSLPIAAQCDGDRCAWQIVEGHGLAFSFLAPLSRHAAAGLDALNPTARHACNVAVSKGDILFRGWMGVQSVGAFDVYGCVPAPPTCADGLQNQDETGVDCGGSTCATRCRAGLNCNIAGDCASAICEANVCGPCNGSVNALCGGSCAPCSITSPCAVADDCQSGICQLYSFPDSPIFSNRTFCSSTHCGNGIKDQAETDVDCGDGSFQETMCGSCETGEMCATGRGCVSGVCSGGICE